MERKIDKAYLQASSAVPLYWNTFVAKNVIDDEISLESLPFRTAAGLNMPWIQIQLPKQLWVKQVALHATTKYNEYLEVLPCTIQFNF